MADCLTRTWGNPSSLHACGQLARAVREAARRALGALINTAPSDILFTSGATEATNQLLLGPALKAGGKPRHLDHQPRSSTPPCWSRRAFSKRSALARHRVGVNAEGVIDPQEVAGAIAPDTALISVMLANNDTGVIQPVREIAALAHARGVPSMPTFRRSAASPSISTRWAWIS